MKKIEDLDLRKKHANLSNQEKADKIREYQKNIKQLCNELESTGFVVRVSKSYEHSNYSLREEWYNPTHNYTFKIYKNKVIEEEILL